MGSATLNELPDRAKRPKHSTNKTLDKSGVCSKAPKVADAMLRQASLGEEDGESTLETFHRNPVGNYSHPVRASHPPEASLASSSAMAARSVDSECKSCVIEPRNKAKLREPSSSWNRGLHRPTVQAWWERSCRGLRAGQMHTRVP